jgi:two-component system sensor histidine kinase CreC
VSIRARIFFVFIAAVVAGFGLLGYWVTGDLRFRYSESFEEVMVDSTRLLAEQLAEDWPLPEEVRFQTLTSSTARLQQQRFSAPIYSVEKTTADIRLYVTDAAGKLLFDSRGEARAGDDYSQWRDVAQTLKGRYGARTSDEQLPDAMGQPSTVSVAYVAAPVFVGGDLVGVISMGKPKTNIQRFIANARRKLFLALLAASAVAIVLAFLLYSWVSRPLQSLVAYANDVSEGKPTSLPELGDNEVGRVGNAIASMRKALEDKQYVESYVQSLTHEIKSPLTAIRASAELLEGELPADRRLAFVTNIERESDRLSDIADRLLELASLERADRLTHVESVSLHQIAAQAVSSVAAQAAARAVQVHESYGGNDVVFGDPLLLRQVIDNLLRNALDFSPAGSGIDMVCVAERGGVMLTVQDQGAGIPAFARERIFDRFYSLPRPDTGRKSTGLGLNFVREVAKLHGGSIQIDCPDRGTRARLFIPWRLAAL